MEMAARIETGKRVSIRVEMMGLECNSLGIIGILSKNYDAIKPHCISFK